MNHMHSLLLLVSLFFLVACGESPRESVVVGGREAPDANSASQTATETPLPAPRSTTILAEGQLLPVNPALTLGFAASGRLLEIRVRAGDLVSKGDLLATLDDEALRQAVTNAELQVAQAEADLAQAQLSLDQLLSWEPDELAVALAEANLAAAEASYLDAQSQDAAAGNSLTAARVSVDQAERALTDAHTAYDKAWDPGREWELYIPGRREMLERERDITTRAVQQAEEGLTVARANYNLAVAGLSNDTALGAQASVASAQQALHQAQTGPTEADIAAARIQLTRAELSLQQATLNLSQAQRALEDAMLWAPWSGTVLSVEASPGAMVGSGNPVVTLLDAERVSFHTNNLSERDLAQIGAGLPARITLKTYPGQTITGRVAHVIPKASGQVGDAATFTVVIELDQTDLDLWPGMTGRAEILSEADGE